MQRQKENKKEKQEENGTGKTNMEKCSQHNANI
jgi:hypothetical protein